MTETVLPRTATTSDFETTVLAASAERPVLVDFWAAWCAPCRAIAPLLERLAVEYEGRLDIVKVDADAEPAITARYGVRSLPTLAVFRGGRVVDAVLGAQPEALLRTLVEKHIERPGDREREQALATAARGEIDPAVATLRRLAAAEPDRPQHYLALIDVLTGAGRLKDAAETILHAPLAFEGDRGLEQRRSRLAIEVAAAAHGDAVGPEALSAAAALEFLRGRAEPALDGWLSLMGSHPAFGRRTVPGLIKAAFGLLGEDHPLVGTYRRRLASLIH